jgi:hypothetical protein
VDGVAVIVVEDKNAIVSTDGWYNKMTSLIRSYLASDGLAVVVDVMCAMIGTFLEDRLQRGWCD